VEFAQVNREILMEEDKIKRETEAAKAPVDSTTLQLHNLLYEKNHYVKAIRACQDIQTKYPGIELVPEEEFHRAAPDDIREKTLAADAAHDLMLKRLNFELVQVVNCYLLQLCLSPSCYLLFVSLFEVLTWGWSKCSGLHSFKGNLLSIVIQPRNTARGYQLVI
jgi:hypothetical protein